MARRDSGTDVREIFRRVWRVFHVKLGVRLSGSLPRVISMTRFCKSLGDTPGILLACPNVLGCRSCSRSRASYASE
jgi:hypothetical protein